MGRFLLLVVLPKGTLKERLESLQKLILALRERKKYPRDSKRRDYKIPDHSSESGKSESVS